MIRNIHDEINHRYVEDTRKEMKKRKIIYRGYVNDTKYVLLDVLLVYEKIKIILKEILQKQLYLIILKIVMF